MCGIAGFLDPRGTSDRASLEATARGMARAIAHRGPDDEGTWADADAGIALGHRRLSIVDLSPEGHQPMASASGRYVIAFNGEIYNFEAIRAELDAAIDAPRWRGHSDTEVMLAAFERWGVDGALTRFNGMFAFALWDRQARTLHLARDRMGEKPLYYGQVGGRFAFGSELKSLRALDGFDSPGRPRGARALPALRLRARTPLDLRGHRQARAGDARRGARRRQWHVRRANDPLLGPRRGRADGACGALRGQRRRSPRRACPPPRALDRAAHGRRRAGGRVPLGRHRLLARRRGDAEALLASGAHLHDRLRRPGVRRGAVRRATSPRHLGTDHTEVYVTGREALDVVPSLPAMYDEPFADSSQVPTFLVSRIARAHVTVSLSGDAGDELFAGYERYVRSDRLAHLPASLRRAGGAVLRAATPARAGALAEAAQKLLPRRLRFARPAEKLAKLAPVLGAADARVPLRGPGHPVARRSACPCSPVPTPRTPGLLSRIGGPALDYASWMMLADMHTYLPDDILVKVDRAAMAVSLETRVPLLDHDLVAWAWSLPLALKLRDGRGKFLLRTLLDRYVPRTLIDRPKRGFAVPLAAWLRGPLRDWAEHLLDPTRLSEQGFLDAARVRARWQEHLAGTRDAQDELWTVLAFQAWLADAR